MPTSAEFRTRMDEIRARAEVRKAFSKRLSGAFPVLQTGDVLLTRDNTFSLTDLISRIGAPILQRKFGMATYSHAAVCLNMYEVIDAQKIYGLRASPLDEWLKEIRPKAAKVFRPPASLDSKLLESRLRFTYGRPYNLHFAKWFPASRDPAFYCSEFVAYVFRQYFPKTFSAPRYLPMDLPEALLDAGFVEHLLTDLPTTAPPEPESPLGRSTGNFHRVSMLLADASKLAMAASAIDLMRGAVTAESPRILEIASFLRRTYDRPALPLSFESVEARLSHSDSVSSFVRRNLDVLQSGVPVYVQIAQALAGALRQQTGAARKNREPDFFGLVLDLIEWHDRWGSILGRFSPGLSEYAEKLLLEARAFDALPEQVSPTWMPVVASLFKDLANLLTRAGNIVPYAKRGPLLPAQDRPFSPEEYQLAVNEITSRAESIASHIQVDELYQALSDLASAIERRAESLEALLAAKEQAPGM